MGRDVHEVTHADRTLGGLVIRFEDGRVAFYSADLLYEDLPKAQVIEIKDEDKST